MRPATEAEWQDAKNAARGRAFEPNYHPSCPHDLMDSFHLRRGWMDESGHAWALDYSRWIDITELAASGREPIDDRR